MKSVNDHLFDLIFNFANKSNNRKNITAFITIASCYLFFILYGIGYLYIFFNFSKFGYISLIKYISVPLITIVIAKILRKSINSKRPFENKDIESLVKHKGGNSMPSNHSASAMVLAFALIYLFPSYSIPFIFLAILTGVSRIMAGLHYPLDVLFGFFIGIIIGIFGFFILF